MSDEVPPPALRLKPRARPEPEIPPPAVPVESSAPVASEGGAFKLRLRPKLDVNEPVVTVTPEPPQVPTAPFSLRPRLAPDTVPAANLPAPSPAPDQPLVPPAALEVIKFKLKEKAPAASAVTAPIEYIGTLPTMPPPIPTLTEATVPTPRTTKLAPTPPPPSVSKPKAPPPKPPVARRSVSNILIYTLAAVLLAGGYFAYRQYNPATVKPAEASSPKVAKLAEAPAPQPKIAETPTNPNTPSQTLNDLSGIPVRAINKAKATIATVRENEEGRVEAATGGEVSVRHTIAPKPVKAPPPTTSTTQISPGLSATTVTNDVAGDASPAFRNWVAQAKVSGVFKGTPPRALINGRTVSAGQIVDEMLEISFDGVDAVGKSLLFKDASGATVARKF